MCYATYHFLRPPFRVRIGRKRASRARRYRWHGTWREMIALAARVTMAFDDGGTVDTRARRAGTENAFDIPGRVPEHVRPHFRECEGPFHLTALSKDLDDIRVTDDTVSKIFPARCAGRAPRAHRKSRGLGNDRSTD